MEISHRAIGEQTRPMGLGWDVNLRALCGPSLNESSSDENCFRFLTVRLLLFICRLQVVLQALGEAKSDVLMPRESQLSDRSAPSESVSVLSIEKVPQDGNATRR